MQKHPFCLHLKVIKLPDVLRMLEEAFPVPPAPRLFIPIKRPILEAAALDMLKRGKPQSIEVRNLKALNKIRKKGLWNGTVQVFELGSTVLNSTKFRHFLPLQVP
mmetsp:Transcript_1068/g.2098  ORF Transcript_1068/g.2098 Transcript_1068/m.2098 type:complete len:105 (-) Transcript_1068:261-575(-)